LPSKDYLWTGLGLDWIRTIANFVEFGLDPDCKSLRNLGTGPDLDWAYGKGMRHFLLKGRILKIFWTSSGLGLHIWNISWTVVGLGLSF